jgi:NADH-quinone oxidoreductase subunit F
MVAAFAIEADIAYIFLRGEYTLASERLAHAIAEAYERQYLGKNIFGSGYSLELYLHLSGGRYICGDETGLLNALEGKRANPRSKPPFPPSIGLFGKPTIVNNVETICCVPHIINRGATWFHGLGRTKDGGTKLFGVSGKVKHPGLWELPMGTTVREILEEHAGGMRDGVKFRGLLPGGASTDFIVEEHLDLAMDFASLGKAGSRMGTGTMIVLDDHTCPVGMTWNLTHFFARESCGFCTPCWSGLGWADRILKAMEEGRGKPGDLDKLEFQTKMWAPGHTFCALAPGAAEPVQSALKHFREDFERHIREHRCPWS